MMLQPRADSSYRATKLSKEVYYNKDNMVDVPSVDLDQEFLKLVNAPNRPPGGQGRTQ